MSEVLIRLKDKKFNGQKAYKQMIDFKREKIGKIIPVAEKNHICLLSNDEEIDLYDDKQLTITGLDGAKSTISNFLRLH